MLSSNHTKPELTKDRIKKIRNEIALQIKKLNSYIQLNSSDTESIGIWNQKISVLTIAQACCLPGGKANLDSVISQNPRYTYKWLPLKGWHQSFSSSNTQKIVDEVKHLCAAVKPLSFESSGFADLFSILPKDIMLYLLGTYLTNIVDIINSTKTATNRYCFYQQNQEMILLNSLLKHAVFGEWHAARKIWERCPDILKLKGKVKRCYEYEHTAYQIAWRNEEDDIIAEMNKFLPLEEQQKQFAEIFPDGQLTKHNWDFEKAKQLLQNVFDAVIKDISICEDNLSLIKDETQIALQALHDHLNPDKSGQCQTGLVCDVRIYQQARSCYSDNFNAFSWHQRTFWCIRVEEMIATFLSTGYLRPHCQGIDKIIKGAKVHSLGCILPGGSSYFLRTKNFLPGVHFSVNLDGLLIHSNHRYAMPPLGYSYHVNAIGILRSRKNINLAELMPITPHSALALSPALSAPSSQLQHG
jgi:hypothetical protein